MRLLLTGLLLWQQVACQSKKDFGKSVLRCACASPTIFESPKSSFFVFPNSKIRFPPINSTNRILVFHRADETWLDRWPRHYYLGQKPRFNPRDFSDYYDRSSETGGDFGISFMFSFMFLNGIVSGCVCGVMTGVSLYVSFIHLD